MRLMKQGLAILLVLIIFLPTAIRAEEIVHEFQGLDLSANLELADGSTLKKGVALIVHGTLAHSRMETIAALQQNLKARGINSLAITLSLGLDRREGMYPCDIEQDHRHLDAVEEIRSWVSWLKIAGTGPITLIGHSRGGNQVALYMSLNHITADGGLITRISENIENLTMRAPVRAVAGEGPQPGPVDKIRYNAAFPKPDPLVKSVVLIAPMTWTYEKTRRAYTKRFRTLLGPILKKVRKRKADSEGMMLMPELGFLSCTKTRVTANAFADYYAPNPYYFTPRLLPFISKPVLVISGSEDNIVPDLPQALADGPYLKNVEQVTIDGADHFYLDFHSEDLADQISRFMKRPRKSKT